MRSPDLRRLDSLDRHFRLAIALYAAAAVAAAAAWWSPSARWPFVVLAAAAGVAHCAWLRRTR